MNCQHLHVTINGNEETGAKSFYCEDCKEYLYRILERGEFIYVSFAKDYKLPSEDQDMLDTMVNKQ